MVPLVFQRNNSLALWQKRFIWNVQNLTQGTQFGNIDMTLAYLHFCKSAAGNITAIRLEPGGKLFLCQPVGLPRRPDLLSHCKIIGIVHTITPVRTYVRTNLSLILAQT